MAEGADVIEVSGVRTCFGAVCIHEDVNLSVHRGEVFAVVGGSGAGKSVLLREMIMLQHPAAGSIRLFGEEVVGIRREAADRLRRRFGVLFQQGALFSSLTVLENVATPLKEHTALPAAAIEEVARLKITLAGLPPDAAHKYPRQLSGGMLKRAGLARALALDPDLLLLDEPSAGLDPISAEALDTLIIQLRESLGLTVVMVTHDLDSLWRVADRAAFLGERTVIGIGSMSALSENPHPAIRAYFQGARGQAAKERGWNQR